MPRLTKPVDRPVKYERVKSVVYDQDNPLTAEEAKRLLGWEAETEAAPFGAKYLLRDEQGTKVRCTNNVGNRPFNPSIARLWRSEILQGHWKLNGESLIIGHTGTTISAQHRLIGLILAVQQWEREPERYPFWQTDPVMHTVLVQGIDESDAVVNTIDTGIPRSLGDVIYRSGMFSDLNQHGCRVCSRMASYAIRLLRHRTGASLTAFNPHPSHADSLDFLERHDRLLECVRHIYEEDGDKDRKVAKYLGPGYASGLLYLMATSSTSSESAANYYRASDRHGGMLDWDRWNQASDYWVNLAAGGDETSAVRHVLGDMLREGSVSNAERWAVVALGWIGWVEGERVTPDLLVLEYEEQDGLRRLAEHPSVGGIDLGDPRKADETLIFTVDPTPAEIDKRAASARRPKLSPHRAGDYWADGDVAWIYYDEEEEQSYLATVVGAPYECTDGIDRVMVCTAQDEQWEVEVLNLTLKKPSASTPATKKKPSASTPAAKKPSKQRRAKGSSFSIGALVWVMDDQPWQGQIVEHTGKSVRLKVAQGHRGAGSLRTAHLANLSHKQPQPAN